MLLYCTKLEPRVKLIRPAVVLPVILSLFLIVMGLDVFPRLARADSPSSLPETEPRIVAFGDSLTAGLGVGADEAYPAQLQRRLDALGFRYRVINAGVSGETTAGGLRRVPWVLKNKPEIVILELGANDGLRGLRLEETKANLEQMIQQIQRSGARIVLAGMKLPPNYGKDYIDRFERIYPELAKRYHLPFIPFFLEGVAGSGQLNQADGIHPTAAGYERVVEGILQKLRPLLNKDTQIEKYKLLPS